MTLEELLSMTVQTQSSVTGKDVAYTPDFRVAVQGRKQGGVHFIIHANGHNSETLDLVAIGDRIERLGQPTPDVAQAARVLLADANAPAEGSPDDLVWAKAYAAMREKTTDAGKLDAALRAIGEADRG